MRLALALGGAVVLAAFSALAQPAAVNQAQGPGPTPEHPVDQVVPAVPAVPIVHAPPPANSASNATGAEAGEASNALPAAPLVARKAPPPPGPPQPVRSNAAVLQALDKVTAETMRFAAPVGQPIRYKNLVFTVKACDSSGLGGASPRATAYVVIDLAPPGSQGYAPPPPKRVFRGWMFASSPSLNPFQHPVYDAWLVACMTAPPKA
ncbi:MAG: DUF2155 domain-containing protein [Caulobacteraceae bacterium]